MKSQKSPGMEQILTQLIQAEWNITEIHELINSLSNKQELSQQMKESIILLVYKKDDKIFRSDYSGIPQSFSSYKILSSVLSELCIYTEAEQLLASHAGLSPMKSDAFR
jgi:hypothetical protein